MQQVLCTGKQRQHAAAEVELALRNADEPISTVKALDLLGKPGPPIP